MCACASAALDPERAANSASGTMSRRCSSFVLRVARRVKRGALPPAGRGREPHARRLLAQLDFSLQVLPLVLQVLQRELVRIEVHRRAEHLVAKAGDLLVRKRRELAQLHEEGQCFALELVDAARALCGVRRAIQGERGGVEPDTRAGGDARGRTSSSASSRAAATWSTTSRTLLHSAAKRSSSAMAPGEFTVCFASARMCAVSRSVQGASLPRRPLALALTTRGAALAVRIRPQRRPRRRPTPCPRSSPRCGPPPC